MTQPQIDLSLLAPPDIVEALDFETLLSQRQQAFLSRVPESQRAAYQAALQLESEPINLLLQESAYRELVLRARINAAAQASMLAFATGANLDQLAALLGVKRLSVPGINDELIKESDTDLRRRTQLAIEGTTVAGSRQAYLFHTLSAHADVIDAHVSARPHSGDVIVTVLSRDSSGIPTPAMLEAVRAKLSADDVRPLSDTVIVQAATIKNFSLKAALVIARGPSPTAVKQAALDAVQSYLSRPKRLGVNVVLSALIAALHQPNVQRVTINEPTTDQICLSHEAAICTDIALTIDNE